MSVRPATLFACLPVIVFLPAVALAQDGSVKLAVGNVGIGIGDVRRLDGLRINFRDRHLERIRGLNATLWAPHDGSEGRVIGIALGLPLTGGSRVTGLAGAREHRPQQILLQRAPDRQLPPLTVSAIAKSATRAPHLASGSGRSWNFTTLLDVPLPPSMWNGARVLTVAHRPLPFQPASGSSTRASIHLV